MICVYFFLPSRGGAIIAYENTASRRNLVSLAGYSAARHAKRRYGVLPYGRQSEPKADRLSEVRTGAVGPACPPDPTPRVCNIRRALLDSPVEGTGFEPVWGFSCQAVFLVCCRFFVRSGKAVLRSVACDGSRSAQKGVKGPKR